MHICVAGINHRTAPVAIREKAAFSADKFVEGLTALKNYVPQGVILSTCNRTELYAVSSDGENLEKRFHEFFKERLKADSETVRWHVYMKTENEAVNHLFRVASGLESLVVGEHEVLGQVRQSLEIAETAGMVNLALNKIFHSAIQAGRRVREKTEIGKNPVSISSVAVDLAAGAVTDFAKSRMLIIGAGEAGQLVGKVAREKGVEQIVIASRTRARAQELATALNGAAVDLHNLEEELQKADMVVTCAATPHRVVDVNQIENIMEKRSDKPLVIIDIAIPRNVVPEVGKLKNIFLYSIDDLTEISNLNRQRRKGSIQKAEEIIKEELEKFIAWWRDYEVRPMISALMGKAEDIRTAQLARTLKYFPAISDEQRESLESMTKSIVTRILQDPIQYLKDQGGNGHSGLVKDIFQLNLDGPVQQ